MANKQTIATLSLMWILLLYAEISASQSIHLLLVADTTDANLVSACMTNVQRIEKKFTEFSSKINYRLKVHKVIKSQLAYHDIDALIKGLKSQEEDIIFFHYSGHGINSQTDQWPKFLIYDPRNQAKLSLIKSKLSKHSHRLLICMADCCNLNYSSRLETKKIQPKTDKITTKRVQKSLEKLFLHNSGSIICSGSQPGRPSHYESALGGYFTTSFFLALFETEKGLHLPNWKTVLDRAAGLTFQMTSDVNLQQRPQYVIEEYNVESHDRKNTIPYTVKKGDTLFRIAQEHQITLENLRRWNNIAPTEKIIQVGEVLFIHQNY
jgi:FOG: LysM repeat